MAVACLVVLLWGNALVVRFVQNNGKNFTELVAEEVDGAVFKFSTIGKNLASDPSVLRALNTGSFETDPEIELELYRNMFDEIRGYLSVVEVHLSSSDGKRKFSSTEYPRRYDVSNHQIRDSFFSKKSSGPQLLLAPGPGSEGNQIAFSIWYPLENGILLIDVRTQALETPLLTGSSSKVFLVNRKEYSSLNLAQPHDTTSFSENPELGIVFTDEFFYQPSPRQLVHRRDLVTTDLSVIMSTDLTTYFETLHQILLLGLALVIAVLGFTLAVSVRISRSISRPISNIIHAMTSNPQGPLPILEAGSMESQDELKLLIYHYNRMVETIESLILRIREEEQLLRESERRALQAQIQPHFLYNTLGAVKSMAKLGDFNAVSSIITDLGKILRFSLSDNEAMVPLEVITDQVRHYLNIQKIRYQERMHFMMYLDPKASEVLVPKLIVESLIENAVVHGVEKSPQPVEITLVTIYRRRTLEIRVEDTGPGIQSEKGRSEGLGIGLANVQKRLQLIYGDSVEFRLFRKSERTIAMIRISL